eukprot:3077582-Rhodomonas_salina.3
MERQRLHGPQHDPRGFRVLRDAACATAGTSIALLGPLIAARSGAELPRLVHGLRAAGLGCAHGEIKRITQHAVPSPLQQQLRE